jgi:hypothetical protein
LSARSASADADYDPCMYVHSHEFKGVKQDRFNVFVSWNEFLASPSTPQLKTYRISRVNGCGLAYVFEGTGLDAYDRMCGFYDELYDKCVDGGESYGDGKFCVYTVRDVNVPVGKTTYYLHAPYNDGENLKWLQYDRYTINVEDVGQWKDCTDDAGSCSFTPRRPAALLSIAMIVLGVLFWLLARKRDGKG